MTLLRTILLVAGSSLLAFCSFQGEEPAKFGAGKGSKMLIAHRGASAYAPEHTREAYELALDQGADFLEPDLQASRDGVLLCLHDLTLERTTNVQEVFPDRYREEDKNGQTVRRWYAHDFTLKEIKSLDAGSWFDERFRGAQVLTLAEAIELAIGKAGLIPETKFPEIYRDRGFELERLLMEELERFGLHRKEGNPATPIIIQSFSPESLRILRHDLGADLPLILLVSPPDSSGWLTPEGLEKASHFASGIGPHKSLLLSSPAVVAWAHQRGFQVIPYTFRSSQTGRFRDVAEEMTYFLFDLGVDGLFTDNPDQFPRTPR